MDVVDFFRSTVLENIRFDTVFTQNLREIPEKLPRGTDEVLEKSLQTSWTFERIRRGYCDVDVLGTLPAGSKSPGRSGNV